MAKKQVCHPMEKLQSRASSLVNSKIVKPSDPIGKIALLFGEEWSYWKSELLDFGFTMQDPLNNLLVVEAWEDDIQD
jgi:hypothetical protein